MKKIITLVFLFAIAALQAQGKAGDSSGITLTAYMSDQIDGFPAMAKNNMLDKLSQIGMANGMGGNPGSRFIITANVVVMSKDITPTVPPMQAVTLGVTLYIGDGLEGTKFASQSVTLKGVGENETKAYISALKGLRVNDPQYQTFIEKGKNQIMSYYNSKCDQIIKDAKNLAAQGQYDEAIYKLAGVPDATTCYAKSSEAILPIYKLQIQKDCQKNLALATNAWNANQNSEGATAAAEYLAMIDPAAPCFGSAKDLSNRIAKAILARDNKEWEFQMKLAQAEIDDRKATLQAARDIGVAYGNGMSKATIYNVRGWW